MIRITPLGVANPAPLRPRQARERFALPGTVSVAAASTGFTGLLGLQEAPDQARAEALQHAGSVLDALCHLQAGLLIGIKEGEWHPDTVALLAALDAMTPAPAHPGLADVLAAIRVRAQVVALQVQRNPLQARG